MLDSKFVYQKVCQENHQEKIIFPGVVTYEDTTYALCVAWKLPVWNLPEHYHSKVSKLIFDVSACVAIYLESKNIFILIKFIYNCYDEWLQDGQEIHN